MISFSQPATDPTQIEARKQFLTRLYARCSDTGKGYRALNRTLANLPPVPDDLMQYMKRIHLQRPMTDQLELWVLLAASGLCSSLGLEVGPLWHDARRADILRAMGRLSETLHNQEVNIDDGFSEYTAARDGRLSPEHEIDVKFFVAYLVRYGPRNFQGGIVGLAARAIEARKDARRAERADLARRLGSNSLLKAPPIQPPNTAGITFLATVGRLAAEGDLMDNCVMDYVEDARKGLCYLFHVERDGAQASALVGFDGIYSECRGKGHRDNAASRYGSSQLRSWRMKLCLLEKGRGYLKKFF